MNEVTLVRDPEIIVELNQLLYSKQTFLFSFIHNLTLLSQGLSHPLTRVKSKSITINRSTYVVYICFILLGDYATRHSSKSSEESFCLTI